MAWYDKRGLGSCLLLIEIDPRLAAAEEETIGGGNIEDTYDSIYIPKMDRKSGPQDRGPGNRFPSFVYT